MKHSIIIKGMLALSLLLFLFLAEYVWDIVSLFQTHHIQEILGKTDNIAPFLGMLHLTYIYNYFESALIVGRGLALILGLIMVFFLHILF
jgi:hypothetical protein